MQQSKVKRSSILILFVGVALIADLVPAPGLGNGIIQTLTQGLIPKEKSDKVLNSQDSLVQPKTSAQNYISPSARNGS